MTPPDEQAQLREHLAELRAATRGLGKDFRIEIDAVERKLERLPSMTAKEAKYALLDIEDDLSSLGRSIERDAARLPGEIRESVSAAAARVGEGASRLAAATRESLEDAGHRAREGTKNAFAAAAGVRRTPMKEWHTPPKNEESETK
jgi:predicted phage gp36 major capsid-like protein